MKKIICMILLILVLTSMAYAAEYAVTFGWDANTEPDLAGYKMYRATQSGAYTAPYATIPDPNATQYITQLTNPVGKQFFVITAFDDAGNESGYSNEVIFEADTGAPAPPGGYIIKNTTIIIQP